MGPAGYLTLIVSETNDNCEMRNNWKIIIDELAIIHGGIWLVINT